MASLHEIELIEVISELPDIEALDVKSSFAGREDDLFLCSLGFEDRCPWISELAGGLGTYKCDEAIYFEYATNVSDNELNKTKLIKTLQKFTASIKSIQCDEDEFTVRLREALEHSCKGGEIPNVVFDISTCSSKVLLLTLKVLLEFDICLCIVYSEADIYHPVSEEYEQDQEKWTTEEEFGIAKGVGKIIPSSEHPGSRRDLLQECVIVFPTFKPERTKAVISYIDESLITRPRDRVIWIVGDPHLTEDHWRADIIREINKISSSAPSYEVSTFDYKKTLEKLEAIYKPRDCKYHMNISPLGSKLQTVGIALFWFMRQDTSIVFAMPKEYNAQQYSEGCKAIWKINFGNLRKIRETLEKVGQLKIID